MLGTQANPVAPAQVKESRPQEKPPPVTVTSHDTPGAPPSSSLLSGLQPQRLCTGPGEAVQGGVALRAPSLCRTPGKQRGLAPNTQGAPAQTLLQPFLLQALPVTYTAQGFWDALSARTREGSQGRRRESIFPAGQRGIAQLLLWSKALALG